MHSAKKVVVGPRQWLSSERGFAAAVLVLAAVFLTAGAFRFYTHVNHFGLPDALGCIVGAVGGFFLLMIADYLLQHARMLFYPWTILLAGFAVFEPHLGTGLGLAFAYILVLQLKD